MQRKYDRVHVKVNTDFDSTGYMLPRSIIWDDGRVFSIEEIRDFRPASSIDKNLSGDCYTIIVHGEEKFLFFEKTC